MKKEAAGSPGGNADHERIVVLGASVRGAAASLRRCGWKSRHIDLFADGDTIALGETVECPSYPRQLSGFWEGMGKETRVLYTGGIENEGKLLEEMETRYGLLGNGVETVAGVRDPLRVQSVIAAAGLPALEVRAGVDPPRERNGDWVVKPVRGAAGHGIRFWEAGEELQGPEKFYFQRYVRGRSFSAVYVGESRQRRGVYLGSSWQILGEGSFEYQGSIGPIWLEGEVEEIVREMGNVVAAEFGLRGLFGIDFVLEEKIPRLVEVNPRYTASVEIHELAGGRSLMREHLAEFGLRGNEESKDEEPVEKFIWGKEIVYARQEVVWPEEWQIASEEELLREIRGPRIADIPRCGSQIGTGRPICTVFAKERTVEVCRRVLEERSAGVLSWLEKKGGRPSWMPSCSVKRK